MAAIAQQCFSSTTTVFLLHSHLQNCDGYTSYRVADHSNFVEVHCLISLSGCRTSCRHLSICFWHSKGYHQQGHGGSKHERHGQHNWHRVMVWSNVSADINYPWGDLSRGFKSAGCRGCGWNAAGRLWQEFIYFLLELKYGCLIDTSEQWPDHADRLKSKAGRFWTTFKLVACTNGFTQYMHTRTCARNSKSF